MEGIYKVSIVPNDLSTEETVYQIADSLDNLNEIVDDVFNKLLNRIQHNLDRSQKLMQRIEVSKDKVDQLSKMKKAIKIFSSAKYPSCIKQTHYQSVFGQEPYVYERKPYYLSTTQMPQNEKDLQEKLHFFHVKVGKSANAKPKPKLWEALQNISTVGELLIFNTDESPYFGSPGKATNYIEQNRANQNKVNSILDAAPSTITNRKQVLKTDVDDYLYTPGMGHVPELEMPLDLPHLPGIADDLQLSMASEKAIAPSVVTSPTVEVVEDVPKLPELKFEEVPEVPDLPDAVVVPVVAAAPPPPPPPPPVLPVLEEVVEEIKTDVRISTSVTSAPVDNAHSSLMEAIRLAGGAAKAKLKSAAVATSTKTKGGGGDLMADLHAKLSMRRRGISGAERGDSMLHTLARVIPEPAEQSSAQPSSGEDDWE